MGLSVRNLNKSLELKVKRCIALLDEEYKSLNYTIYFYENRGKLQKEWEDKPDLKDENYEQILTGKTVTAGITIGEKGKIKIFLFLFDDLKRDPQEIITLIATIYHEIRHAWQAEKNLFHDEEEIATIDGNLEAYYRLPSEKDAYKFQDEQMKKHGTEILKIFGFNLGIAYELKEEIRDAVYS